MLCHKETVIFSYLKKNPIAKYITHQVVSSIVSTKDTDIIKNALDYLSHPSVKLLIPSYEYIDDKGTVYRLDNEQHSFALENGWLPHPETNERIESIQDKIMEFYIR